ncbi:MAG: hypothetical protein INR69_05640 [Mucilaginibacter polytrichastri]|nr:hypothetical protein [Mucilaginibacter polytrichastri]
MAHAQVKADLSAFDRKSGVRITQKKDRIDVQWPAGNQKAARLVLDLKDGAPLFSSLAVGNKTADKVIAENIDPAFILTVGKRDLISQNGWNIFFDKTNKLPRQSYAVSWKKNKSAVSTDGAKTIIRIGEAAAGPFAGELQITCFNGSPLFNVAAVMHTQRDSTAILYDAALTSKNPAFKSIAWSDTREQLQRETASADSVHKLPTKFRTVIGENAGGSLALFPAPHQYFYPLDEAFNLKFNWQGKDYQKLIPGYAIGIRQDPNGDNRFVPWFNAPPGTEQRLNFFCLLDGASADSALQQVKRFTHNDAYAKVPGHKTMVSHFHNEFIMSVVMAGKPVPEVPNFVKVFKRTGVDIVHLGEFHYTAHPKGPDDKRLAELKALFDQCKRLSDKDFLLLPGEEPNEFFGGHWLQFFPKPVYWIMSRKPDQPFVSEVPGYGKVYRIGDKNDMLKLLETENGLAWTAHARTKGSTGFPDQYKNEAFFKSPHFMGAAWKAMPADLSIPRLGERVLNLMDDMANWGEDKQVIGESDLFTVEPENEMYAHLNVNYLQLDNLPEYNNGWQPVLDAMHNGRFFVSTGEVLLPSVTINGKKAGEKGALPADGIGKLSVEADWTFPLNFVEVISGDGSKVYRERFSLTGKQAFGHETLSFDAHLKGRKWARIELWDAAANGAFTPVFRLNASDEK